MPHLSWDPIFSQVERELVSPQPCFWRPIDEPMRGLGKRVEVGRRPELVAVPPTRVRVHVVGGDEE